MRSKSKERELKYGSARQRADKKATNERGPYLKVPSGAKLFQPKTGTMLLDILPYKAGEGNPCAEEGVLWYERTFYVHRGIGANQESHLCLRKHSKERCPVCEHREKLIRQDSDDEETEELIKSLAPKERQLFNIINLKEPDKGVQLWDVSYHLFGKLLDTRLRSADEEDGWDSFFFLEGGKVLKVVFDERSFGGRTFNEASSIDFKERKEDYDEDILEETHCLDEVLVPTDAKELKSTLLQTAKTDDDDEEEDEDEEDSDDDSDDEEEEERPSGKHSSSSQKSRTSSKTDDDEEEDEESDDEEEEEKPKKKKKPAPADSDDWDDFDDEDDEKPKKKKSKSSDDDEDDDSDDEEEEEEEEEKPKKKKNFGDGKAKVKTRDQEEEEDDEEEESDDDWDEDDEEEKPKKKLKK